LFWLYILSFRRYLYRGIENGKKKEKKEHKVPHDIREGQGQTLCVPWQARIREDEQV